MRAHYTIPTLTLANVQLPSDKKELFCLLIKNLMTLSANSLIRIAVTKVTYIVHVDDASGVHNEVFQSIYPLESTIISEVKHCNRAANFTDLLARVPSFSISEHLTRACKIKQNAHKFFSSNTISIPKYSFGSTSYTDFELPFCQLNAIR